eukprot:gene30948-38799_t
MATSNKSSSTLDLDLTASGLRRAFTPSVFLKRLYADETILQSCLYELLNDTDLALLSLTCKALCRSVVKFYKLHRVRNLLQFAPGAESSDATIPSMSREERLIDQTRTRRVRVSDCLGSLKLQRFYAMSIQNFLDGVERRKPLTYLSMFSCDAGRRICTKTMSRLLRYPSGSRKHDLLHIRAHI